MWWRIALCWNSVCLDVRAWALSMYLPMLVWPRRTKRNGCCCTLQSLSPLTCTKHSGTLLILSVCCQALPCVLTPHSFPSQRLATSHMISEIFLRCSFSLLAGQASRLTTPDPSFRHLRTSWNVSFKFEHLSTQLAHLEQQR